MKTVITDHPFPNLDLAQAIFSRNGIDLEAMQARDPETVIARARTADALMVGMARIDKKVVDALERCKIIVRLGVGFDNVDVPAATARGIMVANIPDFCTEEVSDHAVALILMIARRILPGQKAVREGKWGPMAIEFDSFKRVKEQTVGLYGFGRIARIVAEKAKGAKLNCIAFDPFIPKDAMSAAGVEKVEMKDLLARSDYVSLHTPLTKETESSFGMEQFRAMKRTAWVVNTSRGQVIKEDELIAALDQKLIAGAALDVLAKEPPDKNHPLLNRDNVIVTPHMGGWTWDSRNDLQTKGVEEVVRVLKGEKARNLVNPEVLSKKQAKSG
ncbi:MAG TPA: C-terminal binding protein [Thermodesulfobacteriota bacterium]|nr:C-terminal binding protein [Thermodesulfobacteriota bacterium]